MVNIRAKLEPKVTGRSGIIPQLVFTLELTNDSEYQVSLLTLQPEIMYRGKFPEPSWGVSIGIAVPDHVPVLSPRGRTSISCRLFLDRDVISAIEQRRRTNKSGDVWFSAAIHVKYVVFQPVDGAKTIKPIFESWSGGTMDIKVARSEWEQWLTDWGRLVRTLTIFDPNTIRRLTQLQTHHKISDDAELVDFLLLSTEQATQNGQYARLIVDTVEEHVLLQRLHELITTARWRIWIAGWFDKEFLPDLTAALKTSEIQIRILTKDMKSAIPAVKRDVPRIVKRVGQDNIRFNPELHTRLLIVDDICVVGSMHLMSHIKDRFEAAIETNYVSIVEGLVRHFQEIWEDARSQPLKV